MIFVKEIRRFYILDMIDTYKSIAKSIIVYPSNGFELSFFVLTVFIYFDIKIERFI